MKRIFFEGDFQNPFRFFDQVFSIQGQNELKREFLEEVFNISEDQYNDPSFDSLDIICDLETYVVSNSYESEDGTIDTEYSYKHFLIEKFERELKKIFILIDDHIKFHTNSYKEIQFKILKYQNEISRYRTFIDINVIVCKKIYLNLITRLKKRFNELLKNNNSPLIINPHKNKIKVQKENKFISMSDEKLKGIIHKLTNTSSIKFLASPDDNIKLFDFLKEDKSFVIGEHKITTTCNVITLCYIIRYWILPNFKEIEINEFCNMNVFIKKTGHLIKPGDISTNNKDPKNKNKIDNILFIA